MSLHICKVVMFTFSTFAVKHEVIHLGNDIGARAMELHAHHLEPRLVCFHFRQELFLASVAFCFGFHLDKFFVFVENDFPSRTRAPC